MRVNFRKLAWLALFILLGACASRKLYVAPQSGSVAKVFVRTDELMPGTNLLEIFDDAKNCVGPSTLFVATQNPVDVATSVRATRDVSLRFTSTVSRTQCSAIVSFTPQADRKYYVVPFRDGSNCEVKVLDVSSGDRLPEASVRKRSITPIASGGFCTADATRFAAEPRKANLDDLRDLLPREGPGR